MTINSRFYEARANIAKAMAHPTRIAIIDILANKGELCVCHLTDILGISQSVISKHLSILKNAGILDSRKDGLMVFYSIKTPCIHSFFKCMDKILENEFMMKQRQLSKEQK